jgi:hypothetical protein
VLVSQGKRAGDDLAGSITISGNNNTYGQALRGTDTKPHLRLVESRLRHSVVPARDCYGEERFAWG